MPSTTAFASALCRVIKSTQLGPGNHADYLRDPMTVRP